MSEKIIDKPQNVVKLKLAENEKLARTLNEPLFLPSMIDVISFHRRLRLCITCNITILFRGEHSGKTITSARAIGKMPKRTRIKRLVRLRDTIYSKKLSRGALLRKQFRN